MGESDWKQIGKWYYGKDYGHVPGVSFYEVGALITKRADTYRCDIIETVGTNEDGLGHNKKRTSARVTATGPSLSAALCGAELAAIDAQFDTRYVRGAVSAALANAPEHESGEEVAP